MNIRSSRRPIPSSWTVPLIIGLCAGSLGHAASVPTGAAGAAKFSTGLVNDGLRATSPAASAWDVGGEFRLRMKSKRTPDLPPTATSSKDSTTRTIIG